MRVQFSGVTFIKGSEERVTEYAQDKLEADSSSVLVYDLERPERGAVYLDGKDSVEFMKHTLGVELPEELRGKPQAEVQALVEQNTKKYQPLLTKLATALNELGMSFIEQGYEYAEARKAEGRDAEGQPVKEINV